ncbi:MULTISPECIES: tRNA threonylcarbamoyladenosine dehydratase [Psychrilyobacter]|uniref:tRNA threonylcarbamoyladenosine dehydratase n=1 Tax=Psychrilyobacter piezotolerans TaxID=2293438 RepID=A0ABX9KKP9_9FUSO|nr:MULTISPECIES: tRNA threonylcarbamoyladenosine dehydratase [Psychrilyobacter]MCS5422042.1 tRNA threonylcarbamoyladenosine dehydratase [Psychrilyobacter sp. S5]NDI76360.1 tRNA threonylcarbamoyladenosine dehydratase [Psychrilyobacter piezotolerans]RDE65958.1 tRNA threonylcarbamoyladenosine dehydratase [Psychrilyobacter sp. S5]REI43136.1 tRNA threonylcarbamoyladenosine dehydratase [Psychrilyobacter piezotolerans]
MKQFSRQSLLIGEENTKKLINSSVIVFGLGGVGGFTIEGLSRAGIGTITLVDFDTVDITNLNRQLIATHSTVGEEKTKLFKDRILDINPNAVVNIHNLRVTPENAKTLFDHIKYDYIVDAIDTVSAKLALIEISKDRNIPIISSMGFGNKLDPTTIQISDISKTSVCPLARTIRQELKKRRIKKVKTVFSTEIAIKPKNPDGSREKAVNVGSVSFVPSVAGLIIAGEVIKDLIKIKQELI